MRWKDSGGIDAPAEENKEEYFDEEQFSPWAKRKAAKAIGLDKSKIVYALLGLAIAASLAALIMLLAGKSGPASDSGQIAMLQDRIGKLEERLDKYEAIDEKVTRIWEQAKSFEKFKDRFDRGEASMSLRMDHITMGLEKLQKQFNDLQSQQATVAAGPAVHRDANESSPENVMYHTVAAGDTYYSISRRYGIEMDELLKMNGLRKEGVLKVGQRLMVKNGQSQ